MYGKALNKKGYFILHTFWGTLQIITISQITLVYITRSQLNLQAEFLGIMLTKNEQSSIKIRLEFGFQGIHRC